MNILLTNDDGIDFEGLTALEQSLSGLGNIFVCAPLFENSATSNAITLYKDLNVRRRDSRHYVVEGFPADCINVGLFSGFFPKIDLVVSGINKGVNMGYDVFYSGTVGASRHAAVHGIKSFALSQDYEPGVHTFHESAALFARLLKDGYFDASSALQYNINFPHARHHPFKGIRPARTGRRKYRDTYRCENLEDNYFKLTLGGSLLGYHDEDRQTDFSFLYDGYVTVTPLSLDTTGHDDLNGLKPVNLL